MLSVLILVQTVCKRLSTDGKSRIFCFFCVSLFFVLFMSCVCHGIASVHCCLVVTCWESAGLLHWFLFVMFNCVFVTFPCGILGQGKGLKCLECSDISDTYDCSRITTCGSSEVFH